MNFQIRFSFIFYIFAYVRIRLQPCRWIKDRFLFTLSFTNRRAKCSSTHLIWNERISQIRPANCTWHALSYYTRASILLDEFKIVSLPLRRIENEPPGCAITHWRRWLRHTYRRVSSLAGRAMKRGPTEFRQVASSLFLVFRRYFTALLKAVGRSCFRRLMIARHSMDRFFDRKTVHNAMPFAFYFHPFPWISVVMQRAFFFFLCNMLHSYFALYVEISM